MFRITPYVFNTSVLLYRRSFVYTQIYGVTCSAALKYNNPRERQTCPPLLPPPPPPPKDDRLFWGTLGVMFLAGGFTVYAKRNAEVRDWLTIYAPWFDDFIAIAYEENMTYGDFVAQYIDFFRNCFLEYFPDTKSKKCSVDAKPVVGISEESKNKILNEEDKSEPEVAPCEAKLPPTITKDISEIKKCLKELGDSIVNNYLTARDACANYNKLVEDTMDDFCVESLKRLHDAMAERIDLVKVSLDKIEDSSSKLDELSHYFECGIQASSEAMENTRSILKEIQDNIKAINMQYECENDKSTALDGQWQMVEELILKYIDETQTLIPGLKYDQKKPTVQGDADLLLYHTLRYMQKLQKELEEAATAMTEKVNRGLEILPQCEKNKKAREACIQSELKKRRMELDKEFKKRYDDLKSSNDLTLKDSLKEQLARHQENLQIQLNKKEKDIILKFNKLVAERVDSERNLCANQLSEMSAKLKILEKKLHERLRAECESRRSQELWAAGESLLAATKKGDPIVRVDKELRAIEKASGDGDKLVLTVLKAIPETVREKGVVPESVLRQRYLAMEKTALRVALVERDGAPLPVYFLSWLQSLFLFMKISGVPQEEVDKPPQELLKKLDTFDLLQRARFCIERGNLAAALRYVESLEGASRAAAAAWYDAARSHLETRQAAEAVLAHAAALGLQYI